MDIEDQRTRLQELLAELDHTLRTLRTDGSDPDEAGTQEPDAADSGAHLSDSDRSVAVLEAAERQRHYVVKALERVDQGTYGVCVDCGRSVPDGRLEARPEASRCVECQQKVDAA